MKLVIKSVLYLVLFLAGANYALAQAPGISYSPSTNNLSVGTFFTITPGNSGGAVPATHFGQVTTFAGSTAGTSGYTNATGTAARFNIPYTMIADASGNLYVVDNANNAIRKITTAGVVTTFAGSATGASGFTNATGTAARFNSPQGIAIDGSGNFFVADFNNNAIRKITSAGVVTTFYSSAGLSPTGINFDASGNLLVATQGQLSQIMSITPAGVRTTLAGSQAGYINATGAAARFNLPEDVQTDASGNLLVADYLNNAIRQITSGGVVTTFAGSTVSGNTGSYADGVGTAARFNNPTGVTFGAGGILYVADLLNNDIRMILPNGTVSLVAGSATQASGTTDGTGTAARFNSPVDLYIDGSGIGWVADGLNNSIRKLILTGYTISGGALPAGLTFDPTTGTISGTPSTAAASATYTITGYNGSGFSTTTITLSASAVTAPSISYSPSTNVLTVGTPFTITPGNSGGAVPATHFGQVTTFAGSTAGTSGYTNATGTAARFNIPYTMIADASGNLYVVDNANNAIRKITTAGVVTTFAGSATGASGFTNATGTAARFNSPQGIAIDGSGNFFVADFNNNAIRKITSAGVVTTFYFSAGLSPTGINFDASGNLLVATQGQLSQIMSITPAGVRTTLAGSQAGYINATGAAARFNLPEDVQADASGNLLVADYLNNAIRQITSGGVVTTFAGSTVSGNTGSYADGVGTAARFNNPTGVTFGAGGILYVADLLNNDIRMILPNGTVSLVAGSATQASGTTDGTGTAARFNSPVDLYIDGSGIGWVADGLNNSIRKLILTGYTISGGALPAGLTFDPTTGIISGTPSTITANTTYIITAYNQAGVSATTIDISVRGATPPQFNWTGAVSSDWSTGSNWGSGVVPGATDLASIGVTPFTNQPTVGANVQAGQIILGGEAPITLTVNTGFTLQVNGTVIQNNTPGSVAPVTTLAGNGAMTCTAMVVGNAALPQIVKDKTTLLTSKIAGLTVSDSLVINSSTIDLLSGGLAHNNATFSLEGGLMTVGGRIKLDNFIPPYLDSLTGRKPLAKFVISTTSSLNATLSLADTTALKLVHSGMDSVDFFHDGTGAGKSTVIYAGGNQWVYTNHTAGLDTLPYTYQNLSITGSGTKTAGRDSTANNLNIGGDLVITGGTLDLATNKPVTVVDGNFNNTATINFGTRTATFNGPSFFNAGSFNVSTGVLQFSGGTQNLRDSTASGTNFNRVTFNHTGSKNIQTGKFAIIENGKIRLSDTANLNVDTGATLTLRADSTGQGSIAALINDCSVTGQVSVEQFFQGSTYLNNVSARGDRYISSPVYSIDSLTGDHVYNLNYLHGTNNFNGIILSGATGGGFDVNGNPTIFILREDVNASSAAFTAGNWKGFAKINYSDPYLVGTQQRFTTGNVADTTLTFPIGQGLLIFFRGNKVMDNGTTTGTKTTTPYNYPESVTMTNRGFVNHGEIKFKDWFRTDYFLSYTNSPAILNVIPGANFRGANLFGNPYPAAINWDNLSETDTTSNIYGPNLIATIQIYNVVNNQYETYTADPSHDRTKKYMGSGTLASNFIPSSQGFIVIVDSTANPYAATLRIREEAKFDADAGSSPEVFSFLAKRQKLNSTGIAISTAKKSPAKNSKIAKRTPIPGDPDLLLSKPAGSVTPALKSNGQKNLVEPEDEQLIRLKLMPLKDTVKADHILINFKDNAVVTYKPGEDASDPGGSPEAITMLSSYSSDGVKLAINSSPLPQQAESIKLYTDATLTGEYLLDAFLIQKIPAEYRVLLKDHVTGKQTDLRKNARYAFTIDKTNKMSYGDRFELIIEKTGTLN